MNQGRRDQQQCKVQRYQRVLSGKNTNDYDYTLEPGSQIAQTNTNTTTITITIIMTNLGFLITASLLHNNKRRLARTNTHIHSPRHSSIKKLRYD